METAISVGILISTFIGAFILGQALYKERIRSDEAAKKKIKEAKIADNHDRLTRIKSMLRNKGEPKDIH